MLHCRKFALIIIPVFLILLTPSKNAYAQFLRATPPVADIEPHWRIIHGDSVLDNYFWMYDYFGKGPDSTKAVEYLKAENRYVDTVMGETKKFQSELFLEMKSRINEKDATPPVFYHGYYYYYRTETGKQYYKYCRKKGSLDAREEILLDVDKMAEGHSYFATEGFDISPDNKLLAFGVDTVSRLRFVIYIRNLETGEILKDHIENTEGNPCWANDNKTFFYTSKNPVTLLSEKINRHALGTESSADQTVYEEKDKANYIFVSKSKNDKYIFIRSWETLSMEIRMIPADSPYHVFTLFQPRMKEVQYEVAPLDDKFLILTNKDSAKNFKLMECPLDKTEVANWKEVIPVRKDVLLVNLEEFRDFIVLSERKEGLIKFRVIRTSDRSDHYIDFGEADYYADFDNNPDFSSHRLRFEFTSLKTPQSIFDYSMENHEKKLIKQEKILGGYAPEAYSTERFFVTARDGARVPVSLIYKKGFIKNGQAPLLLYGYGSYGSSEEARFNSSRLSLLNRGFVFAIAHVRGGQEMGRAWYDDGKMMKKKNTFNDFIDCGEWLVKEKYTSNTHLYAWGRSAGGLLMGAVTTIAPDLWHGVIAVVPFVDVINTMLDENIPLTTNEFDEWGNPKEKAAYDYMKSYNPYENVHNRNYPNLLVETGLHDSQVQYFEPAKWVAKLRAMKTDNNILLLHTNMDFGHHGASGRFDYLKNTALEFAFLFTLEGISK